MSARRSLRLAPALAVLVTAGTAAADIPPPDEGPTLYSVLQHWPALLGVAVLVAGGVAVFLLFRGRRASVEANDDV